MPSFKEILEEEISFCTSDKDTIWSLFNEFDIEDIEQMIDIDWLEVIKDIMDCHQYGNDEINKNIENNLIDLFNLLMDNPEGKPHKEIKWFYCYSATDCHYEYILDDMPILENKIIEYIKNNS